MKWRLNENSKIIVPGSETSNWYLFNGKSFEQVTPTVNGGNLEFTVSENKAVISLIRTNFDILDDSQLYGKIKAERILESLKVSNNINTHRVTGDNLLTDGSFEEWNDEHDLKYWAEYTSGSSTVNRESIDVIDGNYAVRMDIDTDNSYVHIARSEYLNVGIHRCVWWGKGNYSVNIKKGSLFWNGAGWQSVSYNFNFNSADWEECEIIFNVDEYASYTIIFKRNQSASQSIYFDNAKLEKIGVIEHYDARGGLKVVSDGTSVKKYAIDSQSSKQAELEKVWM